MAGGDLKDEDQGDAIVVLRDFDTSIEANIARTKLEAYGVPCFLTEENMANLYPGQGLLAFTVRLHVFESDRARATEILSQS